MALDLGGRHAEAERAYEWLRRMQRPDGAWHAYYLGNEVEDPTLDTNVTCYIANGVWHHYLVHRRHRRSSRSTGRSSSARSTSRSTTSTETGEIAWRRRRPAPTARCCSPARRASTQSLRCAIAVAERLGHERPDWELSLGSLAIAIAHRPERFLDKERWAMDWYYPILGGVLRGHAAHARVAARLGRRSWPRAAACAACPTSRGSPRPRRASS